ncbi:hypothetical protein Tco_1079196 [Tanacetum coccineum]|uniref:Reverse transcriptase domain-containing protein n=1 Tax=Tanacetum coccineum TaxID=301880 RepID=A0ABQ5HR43_9ASTR
MSTSTHPIIILSDSDVEDAFSSTNTPDYTPASPDYSPASPGNTSSDPSEDSSKDRSASLTISPFHDDPYMKVMQAYNATSNESPIPLPQAPIAPPTVLPSSLVLPPSPLFDPRDFFLPEEIVPPRKRARFLSSSSTDSSAPPHVFKIGESSHVTRLERHKEQIETILNHLDELHFELIEHMEDKIQGLGHADEIVLASVRISTLEMIIEDIQTYVCRGCLSYVLYYDYSYLYVSGITMVLLPSGFLKPLYPGIMDMINDQDIEHRTPPTPLRDTEPLVRSPISLSPSSSVVSSLPVTSTTPPPDYPFDETIFAELDNSLWIIPRPLKSEQSPRNLMSQMLIRVPIFGSLRFQNFLLYPAKMTPKKTSTSAAPPMTQAAIKKLVADSVAIALEAQAAIMANTDNTNRNTRQRETPIERKCSYKEFMNCQPFNFKGTEGAVGLIHWFKRTELVFLRSNYTKDCKVKFATGTLTEEAYPSGIHSPNLLE